MEQSAQTLASLAGAIRMQLFAEGDPVRVAFIGGVFRSRILLDRFKTLIELTDGCECIAPLLDPAAGALLEAFRAVGHSIGLDKLKV
jgi:hypothetical protein